jgi:hypothetical protein
MPDDKYYLRAKALEIAVMMLGQARQVNDHQIEPTIETYRLLAESILKYLTKEPEDS